VWQGAHRLFGFLVFDCFNDDFVGVDLCVFEDDLKATSHYWQ
jgi:hypothetical protein